MKKLLAIALTLPLAACGADAIRSEQSSNGVKSAMIATVRANNAAKDKELEGFAFFVGKLSALIPISKAIPALKTLGTMIDYFKGVQDENAKLTAQIAHLEKSIIGADTQLATTRKALEFYADVHKYPAPFTGGMGDLWSDCGKRAKKALVETFVPTHTHLKRGSSYSYFGTGTFQTDSWGYDPNAKHLDSSDSLVSCDMQQVAVYLEEDGKIWVRPVSEFIDGRFARV